MRESEVKRLVRNCIKCTNCCKPMEICPILEESGITPISPPGIFFMAEGLLSGCVEMSAELSTLPYTCTMCGACAKLCSNGFITTFDYPTKLMEGIREVFVEQGAVPEKISQTLRNMDTTKNAWRLPKSQRIDWEKESDISVPDYRQVQNEFLLFVGDASLIAETRHIPGAISRLLQIAGVSFGTLKEDEVDSGNEAREMGESGLLEELARQNIENFKKYSVKKVITISPHDYHAFVHDYPELGMEFEEVYHYTQIIRDLIGQERIKMTKNLPKTVTFQDPCHLGRYNNIYEAPREIIKAVPGVELVEMRRNFDEGFCCGAGGGRMWYDPENNRKQRISDIRIRHAQEAKADIIATACPYCVSNLKAAGNLGDVSIKDISELVLDSISQ